MPVVDAIKVGPVTGACSATARQRLLSPRGEPLFIADWARVLMIHFEVDAATLQACVPFELDLHNGCAFVTLVAFTMEHMRPSRGGKFTAWLFKPIASHEFLNVRTYVRHREEPGILFLAEWLPNRLSVRFGPPIFGLPYRYGKLVYQNHPPTGTLRGFVSAIAGKFSFTANLPEWPACEIAPVGSLTEFLMERYTAYTWHAPYRRYFRVWHAPWEQCRADVRLENASLLTNVWPWFGSGRYVGANYSPGAKNVWMGRPHRIISPASSDADAKTRTCPRHESCAVR